jgi:hypothetical protein
MLADRRRRAGFFLQIMRGRKMVGVRMGELSEEPAVVVRETSPALQLTPQGHQLMSERGILSLKL